MRRCKREKVENLNQNFILILSGLLLNFISTKIISRFDPNLYLDKTFFPYFNHWMTFQWFGRFDCNYFEKPNRKIYKRIHIPTRIQIPKRNAQESKMKKKNWNCSMMSNTVKKANSIQLLKKSSISQAKFYEFLLNFIRSFELFITSFHENLWNCELVKPCHEQTIRLTRQ